MIRFRQCIFYFMVVISVLPNFAIATEYLEVLRFSDKLIYTRGENGEVSLTNTKAFENQKFYVTEGPDDSNFYKIQNKAGKIELWVLGSGIITSVEKNTIDCKSTKNQFAYDSNLYGPRGAGETC